jgi:CheY-like chemotaxis protein
MASGAAPRSQAPSDLLIQDVKVLLVEDDPDGREMVGQLLRDNGAQVRAVDSAAHALVALTEGFFDIVVSDIGMPDVDGYELLKRIRASGNSIPAIALTAFARLEDHSRALEVGYAAHLSKPVEPPALIATVANVALRSA